MVETSAYYPSVYFQVVSHLFYCPVHFQVFGGQQLLKNYSQGLNVLGTTVYICISSPLKTTSEGKNLKPNQPIICFSYKFPIVLNSDLLELHFKTQQQKEK